MKNLKNILTTLLLAFILINSLNAQTIANFKVEHNPSSVIAKVHVVNTLEYRMDTIIPLMPNTGINRKIDFMCAFGGSTSINSSNIDINKNQIGDTVCSINFDFTNNLNHQIYSGGYNIYVEYKKYDTSIMINTGITLFLDTIKFTDFLKSTTYLPCYVSLGPVLSTPTIKWESLENNAIEKYIIKRNGQNIDTVNYSSGILSYTDIDNHEGINYVQTYTLVGIDSLGNIRSGDATSIHARNLASVNGNIELDWNIPTTAGIITSFDIYEYDAILDVLTLVNTVPSTITQYTITNPDVTKMYIVGVPNIDCTGSATRSTSTSLLSNPVQAIGTSGIQSLTIDRNDEVTGYFDLMGREIDANTTNQMVIVKYKSGKTVQKFIQQ
jgi:hypothetical protein